MCVELFIIKTYQKLVKARFQSEPQHLKQSMRDIKKKNLKAHAISCGHAKFCCVTMSNILREKR